MAAWLPWPLSEYFQQSTLALASVQLGRNLFQEGALHSIERITSKPILLIHGSADTTVPMRAAEELCSAAAAPAMLWRVRQAGHAEAFLRSPQEYAEVVGKTFRSVQAGLPPFDWVRTEER